jgi:hypothetical protein
VKAGIPSYGESASSRFPGASVLPAFVESVGPHDKSGQYEKAEPLRQISEQAAYAAAKPDQKVLKAGQWLPAKKNECPSVETGLIVRGENAGTKRLVCCNGACKVHKHTLSANGSSGRHLVFASCEFSSTRCVRLAGVRQRSNRSEVQGSR